MERLSWLFLIAHGLIHPGIYSIPKDPEKPAPFDPTHSWALAAGHVAEPKARAFGVWLSWLTALLFVGPGSPFSLTARLGFRSQSAQRLLVFSSRRCSSTGGSSSAFSSISESCWPPVQVGPLP